MPPKGKYRKTGRSRGVRCLFANDGLDETPETEEANASSKAEDIVQRLDAASQTSSALRHLLTRYPSLGYEVEGMVQQPAAASRTTSGSTPQAPSWCVCGNCQTMNTLEENVCCGLTTCTIHDKDLQLVVLSRGAVAAGMLLHGELRGDSPTRLQTQDEPGAYAKPLRWHAYRLYMMWRCGYLGRGNRQPAPSCVVCAIRRKWPSPDGQYTGYRAMMERL